MRKDNLVNDLDDFFKKMLEDAKAATPTDGDEPPEFGFGEKLKLFQAGVQWVAVKNRLEPEGLPTDAFSKLRGRAVRSAARGGRTDTGPATPGLTNGAARDA